MRMFRSYWSFRQNGYRNDICERQHARTNVARSEIPAHGSRTEGPAILAKRGRSPYGAGRLGQGMSCLRWSWSWHLDVSEVGGGTEKDDGESSWGAGYGRLLNGLLTCMSCPLVTLFFLSRPPKEAERRLLLIRLHIPWERGTGPTSA